MINVIYFSMVKPNMPCVTKCWQKLGRWKYIFTEYPHFGLHVWQLVFFKKFCLQYNMFLCYMYFGLMVQLAITHVPVGFCRDWYSGFSDLCHLLSWKLALPCDSWLCTAGVSPGSTFDWPTLHARWAIKLGKSLCINMYCISSTHQFRKLTRSHLATI